MKEFVQLDEDVFVLPDDVKLVKRVAAAEGAEEETCMIFLKGAGPQDGFVVKAKAEGVVEDLEEGFDED